LKDTIECIKVKVVDAAIALLKDMMNSGLPFGGTIQNGEVNIIIILRS
jgi:hypothetical protein